MGSYTVEFQGRLARWGKLNAKRMESFAVLSTFRGVTSIQLYLKHPAEKELVLINVELLTTLKARFLFFEVNFFKLTSSSSVSCWAADSGTAFPAEVMCQEDLYYFFTNHEREDDFFPCLVGGGTTFLVLLLEMLRPSPGLGCHLPGLKCCVSCSDFELEPFGLQPHLCSP